MPSTEASQRLLQIARKLLWWKPPEQSVGDPIDLACRIMTYGTWDDVLLAQDELGTDLFHEALRRAPAGIFDRRSWQYWHLRLGISPIPPLPKRQFA